MKSRMPAATVDTGSSVESKGRRDTASLWTIVLTCELLADDSAGSSGLEVLRVIESTILPGRGD